jgi:hypothetical protein
MEVFLDVVVMPMCAAQNLASAVENGKVDRLSTAGTALVPTALFNSVPTVVGERSVAKPRSQRIAKVHVVLHTMEHTVQPTSYPSITP